MLVKTLTEYKYGTLEEAKNTARTFLLKAITERC